MINQAKAPSVAIVSFSPTGTTDRVTEAVAAGIGQKQPVRWNITVPGGREELARAMSDGPPVFDYWIVGVPVYSGKIPPIAIEALRHLRLDGQRAVSCVTYGNNEYGTALRDLTRHLTDSGAAVIAAGAFVGEHSFSAMFPIALGRPDEADLRVAGDMGRSAVGRSGDEVVAWDQISGAISFSTRVLPAKGPQPVVDHSQCTKCLTCVEHCPMGILDAQTIEYLDAAAKKRCLGCMSCVKRCPEGARSYAIPSPFKPILKRVFAKPMSTRQESFVM
jgi:Pyruvate/2-oxoacid:ferredoxin oxidoreductase delta subunit